MGLAIVAGVGIPLHFEQHPIRSGNITVDNIFNMLLSIRMLVGGVIAFLMDNIVGGVSFIVILNIPNSGATTTQRGFPEKEYKEKGEYIRDGYSLPLWTERVLMRFPWLQKIPILPHLQPYSPTV